MSSLPATSALPPEDARGLRSAFSPWALLRKTPAWVSAVMGFLILALTITNQSIDMDEAQTWDYAHLDTLQEFFTELRNDPNSESQMPLGMLLTWGWAKIFGTSEYGMRSLNLVWAAITMVAFSYIGRRVAIPWIPLLFAIQPFVWYSMDQARTPMMQMAGGALLLLATLDFLAFRSLRVRAAVVLCLGAVFLCGASMLGVIPLAAVVAGVSLHLIYQRVRLPRIVMVLLTLTGLLLAGLGAYYVSTLMRGAGGAKIWTVSPANALFALYEFLGFQGLGPGRQYLRDIMRGAVPLSALLPYLPGLIILAGTYALLVFAALKSWFTRPFHHLTHQYPSLFKAWAMGIGTLLLSLFLLFILAEIVRFPFWGRHMAGAFPFWVLTLAITIRWALQGLWRTFARRTTLLLLLLLFISSLQIRFAPQHRHDDYRSAATAAAQLAAAGHSVWWVADYSGGEYYGLLYDRSGTKSGKVIFAPNITDDRPSPQAIVISRPENFDAFGTATKLLRSGNYSRSLTFSAFELWERK